MREKNIDVRERQEKIMRRNHNMLIILFLGGGYLVFKPLISYAQGLVVATIFLAWYGYMESYLHRYEQYTNELIKGTKAKPTVKKVAKKKAKKSQKTLKELFNIIITKLSLETLINLKLGLVQNQV